MDAHAIINTTDEAMTRSARGRNEANNSRTTKRTAASRPPTNRAMFHRPRQDVLRLENAEETRAAARKWILQEDITHTHTYIYIYISSDPDPFQRGQENDVRGRPKGVSARRRKPSLGVGFTGDTPGKCPMNERWALGTSTRSSPPPLRPSDQPNSNRIPQLPPPSPSRSRLRSRVVVDRDTDPRYTSLADGMPVSGIDYEGRCEIFWKFSKEESRRGASLKESRGKFLAHLRKITFPSFEISKNLIVVWFLWKGIYFAISPFRNLLNSSREKIWGSWIKSLDNPIEILVRYNRDLNDDARNQRFAALHAQLH